MEQGFLHKSSQIFVVGRCFVLLHHLIILAYYLIKSISPVLPYRLHNYYFLWLLNIPSPWLTVRAHCFLPTPEGCWQGQYLEIIC